MEKLKSFIAALEKTKTTEQIFRALRIAFFGVLAIGATGNPVTGVAIAGVVEGAFRQVFPVQIADVEKLVNDFDA